MAKGSVKRIEPTWYTPEDEDENSPDPFRAKIRALTATEQIDVLATFTGGRPNSVTFRKCFLLGVQKLENYTNGDGKAVTTALEFSMLQDTLDYILEIGAAVFDKSYLTEDEKKTS